MRSGRDSCRGFSFTGKIGSMTGSSGNCFSLFRGGRRADTRDGVTFSSSSTGGSAATSPSEPDSLSDSFSARLGRSRMKFRPAFWILSSRIVSSSWTSAARLPSSAVMSKLRPRSLNSFLTVLVMPLERTPQKMVPETGSSSMRRVGGDCSWSVSSFPLPPPARAVSRPYLVNTFRSAQEKPVFLLDGGGITGPACNKSYPFIILTFSYLLWMHRTRTLPGIRQL